MIYIKNVKNIETLISKRLHMISDCSIFPFNITCKVLSITKNSNEYLIKVRVLENNKILTIGSNTYKLRYEEI